MNKFWQDRSPRERLLITTAAVLLGLFVLYQFIFVPAIRFRDDARQSYMTAHGVLEEVSAGAREAIALREKGSDISTDETVSVRAVAGNTARQIGISMTRLQPDDQGGLNVWFDNVDSELFYRWVLTIRRDYGVGIAKATIRKNTDQPTVRVQVLLVDGSRPS